MKKFFLFFALLLCIVPAFAQVADVHSQPFSLWDSIISIFLPAVLAQFLVLFSDAKKYYGTPEWNWSVFFNSKIKPFILTTVLGIVIYIALIVFPFSEPFVNVLAGTTYLPLTSAALFGAASAIIDGFSKKY